MSDEIRDHGKIVTAPAGTPQDQIAAKLTGASDVPSYAELSQAKVPEFDPHAGREVEPGREFAGGEPMISTMVFVGIDEGGDFEDAVNEIVAFAESRSLLNLSATIGPTDATIYNAVSKLDDGET